MTTRKRSRSVLASVRNGLRSPFLLALASTSTLLLGTTVITSVLGFVYWLVAARTFTESVVGLAAAMVASMTLLGTIAVLGFGTLLIRELPEQRGDRLGLILSALSTSAIAGVVAGALFVPAAGLLSDELAILRTGPIAPWLFSLGVGATAFVIVLDQALIGLGAPQLQLVRNTVFSVSKLAILIAAAVLMAASIDSVALLATWLVAYVVSALAVALLLRGRRDLGEAKVSVRPIRALGGEALKHHMLNVSLQSPSWAMPIIVTATVSAEANAAFYVAWTVAGFTFFVPNALTLALFALRSRSTEEPLWRSLRVTLWGSAGASLLALAGVAVLGRPLLSVFGGSYERDGYLPLVILASGVLPLILKDHYIVVKRLERGLGRPTVYAMVGGLLEVGFAAAGALIGGVVGLSIGLVLAFWIEGLVVVPALYRVRGAAVDTLPLSSVVELR